MKDRQKDVCLSVHNSDVCHSGVVLKQSRLHSLGETTLSAICNQFFSFTPLFFPPICQKKEGEGPGSTEVTSVRFGDSIIRTPAQVGSH